MFALIYIAISIYLFYNAVRLMSGGFKAAQEISKPVVEKRQVTRAIHPEMVDVKNGDELMVVNFQQVPQDPMLQSLKKRLDTGPQIDDPWDDDDDDGDGDVPAKLIRT
tara:strand:+ start:3704 stop:4027 length:324 start_codon:yes stop_codon:yes gene_type:complete